MEVYTMNKGFMRTTLAIVYVALMGFAAQAQQRRVYRTNQSTLRPLILRLENRSVLFRNSVQGWMDRNPNQTFDQDINLATRDFDDSVRRLHDRFDRRQATAADAQEVLLRATRVDDFMRRNNMNARTMNYWSSMRVDLNQLAKAYSLSWPIASTSFPQNGPPNRFPSRLTGTYRLDASRSDDARQIAERATRDLAPSERRRVLDSLTRRLDSPDEIAIDVKGRTVTIASTRAPQISFIADGSERAETNANGRTIHTRASLNADELMVSSTGDTGNDFSVTFDALDTGQRLNVTRRVYTPALTRPVVVQSSYLKTAEVARFDIYNPRATSISSGGFIVPDGTRVVARLDDALSTRTAAVGDRFTMRVNEPAEFDGATIEGHLSHIERSGRLTGRSMITLDFDRIRLRDGRSYDFAGLVENVRATSGERVRVDTEGAVREESQTTRTEQRAAIGTAVGAIIGAIAGGGKGAAIGAILGAGGGAGSVYVEGQKDLELGRGTEITIRAGAPANTPR